jgi:hypothetical protein
MTQPTWEPDQEPSWEAAVPMVPDAMVQPAIEAQRPTEAASGGILDGIVTTRIELPSGGWAEIADAREIRAKHRKRLLDRLNVERLTAGTAGVSMDVLEGLMLLMIDKWQVPYFPDSARPLDNPALLEELTIPDYDALSGALEPARKILFPSPVTIDDHDKPGSPTQPGVA